MATTIVDFIEQAWADQVEDPGGVAARLERALPLLRREPARTGDFLALAERVLLAGLGDADAMARWIERLASLALEHPDASEPLARSRLAVGLLRGEAVDAHAHARAVLVRAHGSAAGGAAARGDIARVRRLLQAAEQATDPADTESVKALAEVANDLAVQLLARPRAAAADALMMEAAELAQRRWHQAGTWLQAERSDYLLALGAAAIGDSAKAMRHAGACLSLCTAHGADAFEHFCAHEALARASLAAGDHAGAADASARMHELLQTLDEGAHHQHARSVWGRLQTSLGET